MPERAPTRGSPPTLLVATSWHAAWRFLRAKLAVACQFRSQSKQFLALHSLPGKRCRPRDRDSANWCRFGIRLVAAIFFRTAAAGSLDSSGRLSDQGDTFSGLVLQTFFKFWKE